MPDNVVISSGSGTTVAADEVVDTTLGTVKVQYVKLVDGTLDGTGKIAGDAANGLDVDVTRLPSLPAGVNNIGDVDVLTLPVLPAGANTIGTINQAALTKGTQGATGVTTQDLKDAGRNQTNYHMTLPIVTTATDALQSLTGYKANAAVAATTTPVVVTAGKTYRITAITLTCVAIATAGSAKFTLRFNAGGVVAIASPAVVAWVVGGPAVAAGVANTIDVAIPDGLEFPAGGGIGVSMVGLGATQVAAAVGYGHIAINGFEF